jgi:hypothetical protein
MAMEIAWASTLLATAVQAQGGSISEKFLKLFLYFFTSNYSM